MTPIEQVARAIEGVDPGYSIRLTRLVDDEFTYALTYPDGETLEFPSHGEALEHVTTRKRKMQARAAIEAMANPTDEMIEAARMHSFSDGIWRAMIAAALRQQEG